MASCVVLVGISYLMLNVLTGLVMVPKTPVQEVVVEGELVIPIAGRDIVSMQISADGRFLAYIEAGGEGGESILRVVDSTRDSTEIFNRGITGETLAWLGEGHSLVFEDRRDIQSVNVVDGTQPNLTDSSEFDGDPVPSPDGRYILWSRSPSATDSVPSEFWVMNNDGSNKVRLAPWADLATWDPAGGRVISLRYVTDTSAGTDFRMLLQTARVHGVSIPNARGRPGSFGGLAWTNCFIYPWNRLKGRRPPKGFGSG